nr:MAG TPA: hypothetical protein [Caudoviricetes sp.]
MVQQMNDLEKEVDRNSEKLDKIIWLLAFVCAELGVSGVLTFV